MKKQEQTKEQKIIKLAEEQLKQEQDKIETDKELE